MTCTLRAVSWMPLCQYMANVFNAMVVYAASSCSQIGVVPDELSADVVPIGDA